MATAADSLAWIDSQHKRMLQLVTDWCQINSCSHNLQGLAIVCDRLANDFACLGGELKQIDLPPEMIIDNTGNEVSSPLGKAISIRKRSDAPVQVFLCIHMDTVYSPDHPLQHVRRLDESRLNGPGVADAKGGLCVMLIALEALERLPNCNNIGWEVLINPDEELGSPGSAGLLRDAAGRNHLGLVFEPALADGSLVGERKGSGNFSVVIRGRSAHAGRDFHHGRSAMVAAAELVLALEEIHRACPGVTLNVGRIDGGGPSNIVPDLAIVRFNVRLPAHQQADEILAGMQRAIDRVAQRDGIWLQLAGGFNSPPRPMDSAALALCEQLAACGEEMGMKLSWVSSGGVSDANKLSASGLPVLDSLGPSGGNLHNAEEFMVIDSLGQKAKLVALLLSRLAAGEIIALPRTR